MQNPDDVATNMTLFCHTCKSAMVRCDECGDDYCYCCEAHHTLICAATVTMVSFTQWQLASPFGGAWNEVLYNGHFLDHICVVEKTKLEGQACLAWTSP